ncbi:MAG: DUF3276 family protein [bacterium]
MNNNGNGSKELFNKMVKAGRRTYFVTVKESSNNNKYVMITESKLVEKDKFQRSSVMVFPDKIGEVAGVLAEACSFAA